MKVLRILVLLCCVWPLPLAAAGSSRLSIATADGRDLPFTIELAQSNDELARGLMNRTNLSADAGMLFDFGEDRPVFMWMKNTLIPLDMIFIGRDGIVAGIAERTVPNSLDIIASPGPVRAVLEVNGGTADRLRIKAGDRVGYPLFRLNSPAEGR